MVLAEQQAGILVPLQAFLPACWKPTTTAATSSCSLIMNESEDSHVWPIPTITSAFRREYRRNYPPVPDYFHKGTGKTTVKTEGSYSISEYCDSSGNNGG